MSTRHPFCFPPRISCLRWGGPWLCLVFALGGFGLRLFRLGAQSLWYDETVSAYLASQSIPQLISHTAGDIHPPGYYLMLHAWTRLAGSTEFALAFPSLVFGVLAIPLSYVIARRWLGGRVAAASALLIATSAYQVWYSQEVRMYSLAAAIGLLSLWFCLQFLAAERQTGPAWRMAAAGYVLAAALGLYVLYYFAFLLIALNALMIVWLLRSGASRGLRRWLLAQAALLVLYLPWLPIALRQAVYPPVPPWRQLVPLPRLALEAWSALGLGQSVQPEQVWFLLIIIGAVFLLGVWQAHLSSGWPRPAVWLAGYTFAPLGLMVLVSLVAPLYHVRYLLTYAPPFYILLGAGLVWLARRSRPMAAAAMLAWLAGTGFSLHQLHTSPLYVADDLRGAVNYIAERWRPGDAVLINAGYAYTGFAYYYREPVAGWLRLTDYASPAIAPCPLVLETGVIDGSPQLGWGSPDADFYAAGRADTTAALARLSRDFPRLWMLRIYDTVSDPQGVVRAWLAGHSTEFEDQSFAGQSFLRVQGFMSPAQPAAPRADPVFLQGGISLAGWQVSPAAAPGAPLDAVLWWQLQAGSTVLTHPYAVSLKLWDADPGAPGAVPDLIAQQDEWPLGSLRFTPAWPPGVTTRQPMRLRLPAGAAPGQYWLTVEMYDPVNLQPLARLDGRGSRINLGLTTVAER